MLVVTALALIGVILVPLSARMAVQALAVSATGFIFINWRFLAVALRSPASPEDFILAVAASVATLTTFTAAIPSSRRAAEFDEERKASSLPMVIGIGSGGLVLLTALMSLYSTVTFEDARPGERDVLVETLGLRFMPPRLIALEGSVGIHATNRDETLHTLTIPSLGIDLPILPGKSVRTQFRAKAGTYLFSCRRHPEMKGEVFLHKPGASDIEDFIGSGAGG